MAHLRCTYTRDRFAVLSILLVLAFPLLAQERIDLNRAYAYPFSFGVESQVLLPLVRYRPLGVEASYGILDVSGNIRWPIPPLPVLQPTLRFGLMSFDNSAVSTPDTMDHTDLYISGGLTATWRLSKLFEASAEVLGGFNYSLYPNISPGTTLGNSSLLFDAGLKLTLNPIFNVSVELHPGLRYLHSLGALADFDGPIFAVGAAVNLRLGKDPDAGGTTIRAIRFEEARVLPVFAAMQSWYLKHPVGKVRIRNAEKEAVTDMEVSFYQAGYMDSPTRCASVTELSAGQSGDIDLLAAYNQEVFSTVGVTPLNGEILVSYRYQGQAVEQRGSVAYELHDKTAIVWDDDRKAAAFIVPRDNVVRDYASFIRQAAKAETIMELSGALQTAMEVYGALGAIGCLYQADPAAPFTAMRENRVVVDSVSLARDTLGRSTGDCDDLTVLYCSLLESAGVETAFLTVPGHIYAAVNSKVKARDYRLVHPDRGMTIPLKDELWVPVEITRIGQGTFLEAWRTGIEEWAAWEKEPGKRALYVTREAQQLYQPVALKEGKPSFPYGDAKQVVKVFRESLDKLTETLLEPYLLKAAETKTTADYNRLGIRYAQYKRYGKAEEAFRQALKSPEGYPNAQTNLGNLYYLQGDYQRALSVYLEGLAALTAQQKDRTPDAGKLLVNASKTCYALEKWTEAKEYYGKAAAVSPEAVAALGYLAGKTAEGERAAEATEVQKRVLYLGEEE